MTLFRKNNRKKEEKLELEVKDMQAELYRMHKRMASMQAKVEKPNENRSQTSLSLHTKPREIILPRGLAPQQRQQRSPQKPTTSTTKRNKKSKSSNNKSSKVRVVRRPNTSRRAYVGPKVLSQIQSTRKLKSTPTKSRVTLLSAIRLRIYRLRKTGPALLTTASAKYKSPKKTHKQATFYANKSRPPISKVMIPRAVAVVPRKPVMKHSQNNNAFVPNKDDLQTGAARPNLSLQRVQEHHTELVVVQQQRKGPKAKVVVRRQAPPTVIVITKNQNSLKPVHHVIPSPPAQFAAAKSSSLSNGATARNVQLLRQHHHQKAPATSSFPLRPQPSALLAQVRKANKGNSSHQHVKAKTVKRSEERRPKKKAIEICAPRCEGTTKKTSKKHVAWSPPPPQQESYHQESRERAVPTQVEINKRDNGHTIPTSASLINKRDMNPRPSTISFDSGTASTQDSNASLSSEEPVLDEEPTIWAPTPRSTAKNLLKQKSIVTKWDKFAEMEENGIAAAPRHRTKVVKTIQASAALLDQIRQREHLLKPVEATATPKPILFDPKTNLLAGIKAGVSLKHVEPNNKEDRMEATQSPTSALLAKLQARKQECLRRKQQETSSSSNEEDDW